MVDFTHKIINGKMILFVFFLLFSCVQLNAQTPLAKVTLKNGVTFTGDLKELNPREYIILIIAGKESRISMEDIDTIENLETNTSNNKPETINNSSGLKQEETMHPNEYYSGEDKLSNFKGFLLAKGNNVYVYTHNTPCEIAGSEEIKRLLKQDGFWSVVDKMIDAHFTINYYIDLNGRDKAILEISSWRGKKDAIELLDIKRSHDDLEEESGSIREANRIYKLNIPPLQKKIVTGKLQKEIIKEFSIE